VAIQAFLHASSYTHGGYERSPLSQTFHTAKRLGLTIIMTAKQRI
jgi:hypothetical protein